LGLHQQLDVYAFYFSVETDRPDHLVLFLQNNCGLQGGIFTRFFLDATIMVGLKV
jgi:hypothetical protein